MGKHESGQRVERAWNVCCFRTVRYGSEIRIAEAASARRDASSESRLASRAFSRARDALIASRSSASGSSASSESSGSGVSSGADAAVPLPTIGDGDPPVAQATALDDDDTCATVADVPETGSAAVAVASRCSSAASATSNCGSELEVAASSCAAAVVAERGAPALAMTEASVGLHLAPAAGPSAASTDAVRNDILRAPFVGGSFI